MFEVQDLRYATLATVSRCGMVWFSEDVLSMDMVFENYLLKLKSVPLDEGEEDALQKNRAGGQNKGQEDEISPSLLVSYFNLFAFS